jgi:hypothetical protein
LWEILEKVNKDPLLESVFTKGLDGLIDYAKKFDPEIEKNTLSLSYGPCDVCQFVSNKIRTAQIAS